VPEQDTPAKLAELLEGEVERISIALAGVR
jgi:hypothetical protein